MNPWNPSANAIFLDACDLRAGERIHFVRESCGSDRDLEAAVTGLLEANDAAGTFLERPPAEVAAIPGYSDESGEHSDISEAQIGPYMLQKPIGEGGFGVVYQALQERPVRRLVALKILKPGMDSRQVIARFEAERQALALMDHPNIARVLDAGATDGGRPYFVMDLVSGVTITQFCEDHQLSLQERLKLFSEVCAAVQHAHQKGIVHRDIKPSNVLVALQDQQPIPKVIDFGIAKATQATSVAENSHLLLTDKTLFTAYGALVGTPAYMSPEQADLSGLDIDTRTDVYSLGVLLYEILTGSTPFTTEQLKSVAFDEMRRIIREDEPELVSDRLARANNAKANPRWSADCASRNNGSPDGLSLLTSRLKLGISRTSDLNWIVAKAIEKDRDRRYESARSLAEDVERFLVNKPIAARPASLAYRCRKWIRRHPTWAMLGALTSFALCSLALGTWYHQHHLTEANRALDGANQSLKQLNQNLGIALANAQRLEAEALERERLVRLQTYARDMRFAFNAWQAEQLGEAFRYLERHQPEKGQPDPRGFEWHWLQGLFPVADSELNGHAGPLIAADVSPNERWIASGDKVGIIKIRELATGSEVKTLQSDEQEITAVAFSPDGEMLATAGVDRTIRLWNVIDWSEKAALRGHEQTVASITWSPDSRRLASGGRDHQIKIWDVEALVETRTLPEFKDVVRYVAWSPTGEHLAAAVREDGLHLINVRSWQSQRLPHPDNNDGGALAVVFSPSGKLLASGGYAGRLFLHDVASHTQLADVLTPALIHSLAFSPNERQLFAGLGAGQLLVSDLHATGRNIDFVRVFQLGQEALRAVMVPRSGKTLITVHEQTSVVQTHTIKSFRRPQQVQRFGSMLLAISAEEEVACTMDSTGAPQLISFPPAKVFGPLKGTQPGQVKGAWFLPTGRRLVVMDGTALRLYDTSTRRRLGDLEPSDDLLPGVAISRSGKYIAASARHDGEWKVCVWETQTRRRICSLPYPLGDQKKLAFSPDEDTLAVASPHADPEKVVLWNLSTGTRLVEIPERWIVDLEFSPDGNLLALARGWEVLLWNVAERSMTTVLRGHSHVISGLTFSPSGRTLATIDSTGETRLWHVPTRQEIGMLCRQAIPGSSLLFRSPHQLVNYADPQPTKPTAPCDVIVFDASKAADPSAQEKHSP